MKKKFQEFSQGHQEAVLEFLGMKLESNPNVPTRYQPGDAFTILAEGDAFPVAYPPDSRTDPKWGWLPQSFDWVLDNRVTAFGCSGLCEGGSRYITMDFDGPSHKNGWSREELDQVAAVLGKWGALVERSGSGDGLNAIVEFTEIVPTKNNVEHSALASAVVSQIELETGFPLRKYLDKTLIVWLWKRKMDSVPSGKELLHAGHKHTAPTGWQDQVKKDSKYHHSKYAVGDLREMDESQKKLIEWLHDNKRHCVQREDGFDVLTGDLADAHKELDLRGPFSTNTKGNRPNAFIKALEMGAWLVLRWCHAGTQETDFWVRSTENCMFGYLNPAPNFHAVSELYGAAEFDKGVCFIDQGEAVKALEVFGVEYMPVPVFNGRNIFIEHRADGRFRVTVPADKSDTRQDGWVKKGSNHILTLRSKRQANQSTDLDPFNSVDRLARAIVTDHLHPDGCPTFLRFLGVNYKWVQEYGWIEWVNIEDDVYNHIRRQFETHCNDTGDLIPDITTGLMSNVQRAMFAIVDNKFPAISVNKEAPFWLTKDDRLPNEMLITSNGMIHIPAAARKPGIHCREPVTPRLFSFRTVKYAYDPDAKCPTFDASLKLYFLKNGESEELVDELLGASLYTTPGAKIAILDGGGNTGKSKFTDGISRVIGSSCGALMMEDMGRDFNLADEIHATAVIFPEANSDAEGKCVVSTLKRLTGGDTQNFRQKYKRGVKKKTNIVCWLVMNNNLALADMSGAMTRRLYVLHFRTQFSSDVPHGDKFYDNKELTFHGEEAGILNRALRALNRLMDNGWNFTLNPDTAEVRRAYELAYATATAWYKECCIPDASAIVDKHVVKKHVKEWLDENGGSLPWNKFCEQLNHIPGVNTKKVRGNKGHRVRCCSGFRLKESIKVTNIEIGDTQ